ncbi:Hypothetical protein, putative [Bodo saltans]|uniref:Leucine-rich repeat protein n=1 Tax=Bodo saltans TaxID=75058 RepID=A0A0S4J9I8_BODSA|nr:Hypothetical protein, putative [Bodo saltans]|eukprot:CUG77179.1 Hypothetical protein, putative [Bodo saltans]
MYASPARRDSQSAKGLVSSPPPYLAAASTPQQQQQQQQQQHRSTPFHASSTLTTVSPRGGAATFRSTTNASSPAATQLLHDTTVLTAVNKGLTSMRSILHLEEMVCLETLNLHMNLLTSLDRALMSSACMRNLTDLDVSGNELEGLEGVECLVKLQRLNAASNRIHSVSGQLCRPLHELQWFNISFNLLEDILGLRELPADTILFVDISGNLIRRWEAVDALSHCHRLRELRITIARYAAGNNSPASTASPASRDQVDEASLQLLDNPLVGTAGYQDHVRTILPQLVLLDGRRVGFDPLQDPSSIGYHPHATNAPLPATGGQRFSSMLDASAHPHQLRPSQLSVQALDWHQQHQVEDLSPLKLRTTPPSTTTFAGGVGAAKTKHISRSSQTEGLSLSSGSPSSSTGKLQRSVAVEAALSLPIDAAHAQLVQELEKRNSEHAAASQRERSEHRSKVLKLQQLLSSATAERDDARFTARELEASAAHELNQHLQSHAHTVAQVAALKEELQRASSDAERHEQIALKLQRDRLMTASREHDEHKKQKWSVKFSALEREHKIALTNQEEMIKSQVTAAHAVVTEAKDRSIAALRTEVELLKEQSAALKSERRSIETTAWHRVSQSLVTVEAAERLSLASQSLAEGLSMHASWNAHLQALRDVAFRREWDQLLRAYQYAATKPHTSETSTNTTPPPDVVRCSSSSSMLVQTEPLPPCLPIRSHKPHTSEASTNTTPPPVVRCSTSSSMLVQTEPLPPPDPCQRCPALARRVVEIETISSSLAQKSANDQLRIADLEKNISSLLQRHEDDLHEAREGLQEQHQRTVNNLKASMAAQEEAHQREIEDITSEYRIKIDEKRTIVSQFQAQVDHLKTELEEVQRQRDEEAVTAANTAASHAQHRKSVEEGILQRQQMSENTTRVALQNQQLLDAVNTLRHQLVAVDTVNHSLSVRTEETVALLKASERDIVRLQHELRSAIDAKDSAESEKNRMREQLRSIAAA